MILYHLHVSVLDHTGRYAASHVATEAYRADVADVAAFQGVWAVGLSLGADYLLDHGPVAPQGDAERRRGG
jgi:hypothetical protein